MKTVLTPGTDIQGRILGWDLITISLLLQSEFPPASGSPRVAAGTKHRVLLHIKGSRVLALVGMGSSLRSPCRKVGHAHHIEGHEGESQGVNE